MKIRESERAAKKLGELLISFSIDPRIFKQFLGQYIDGQQLPLPQRRDIALTLVMVLMRLARDEYGVIDEEIFKMIGPAYRETLMD